MMRTWRSALRLTMSATEWRAPSKLPEHILAMPHLGEYRHRVTARHADSALHGRYVGPKEGVGRLLLAEQRGHRGLALGARRVDRGRTLHQLVVVVLDRHREAGVRLRVLVRAVDLHVVGQGAQPAERGPHLLRRALEQAAAAQREERVAAEQRLLLAEGIGDVAAG